MEWETVIGLEIHVQLRTQSKIFSGSSIAFGAAPNIQASAVDLGLPGVLPVVNQAVYPKAIAFGLGIGADISLVSAFDRKNYFYPDLPKGYQITQMDKPIVLGGSVEIPLDDGSVKTIQITRAHLEEDAGKSLHEEFIDSTGIDLNRAGTPLLEIVSEPDMRSAKEVVSYARYIHQLVTYLGVSDGNMAEGSLRCDANVSLRPVGSSELGTRTETKNVNSFRFLERAINFEVVRQKEVLESGGRVEQETRLYDPDADLTRPMRGKEEAHDYRYFPDPDLPPLVIDEADLALVRSQLPELPDARQARFVAQHELSEDDAAQLTGQSEIADYFESAVEHAQGESRLTANWINGELMSWLNKNDIGISDSPVTPAMLGQLICRIQDKTVSGKIAKQVFAALWEGENDGDVDALIQSRGLTQITDTDAIAQAVNDVIAGFPDQAEQVRAGEEKVIGFLVGQVMKATSGKANPQAVNELLKKQLLD